MSWWDQISNIILLWGPMVFMGLIVFFLWRTMKLMPKTKPQEIKPDSAGSIKWDEVAGADEAKAELQEVVDFLRDPKRFRELGAKVPKGILLHGPPGTGKTLLAKAVANESGAQFFAQSAVELRRDVRRPRRGAHPAPVRARPASTRRRSSSSTRSTPSARTRGSDNNSEREQTLNQLLVEMDGFATTRRARRDRRLEPAREARPGAAAPRPLRPPDPRLAARRRRPRGDPQGPHAQQAAWPSVDFAIDRAPDRRA